jgi:hypothetical protein
LTGAFIEERTMGRVSTVTQSGAASESTLIRIRGGGTQDSDLELMRLHSRLRDAVEQYDNEAAARALHYDEAEELIGLIETYIASPRTGEHLDIAEEIADQIEEAVGREK